jgi:hypothetical protein
MAETIAMVYKKSVGMTFIGYPSVTEVSIPIETIPYSIWSKQKVPPKTRPKKVPPMAINAPSVKKMFLINS